VLDVAAVECEPVVVDAVAAVGVAATAMGGQTTHLRSHSPGSQAQTDRVPLDWAPYSRTWSQQTAYQPEDFEGSGPLTAAVAAEVEVAAVAAVVAVAVAAAAAEIGQQH
jgi:hypothetical protein